jgi:hypothetical protein
LAHITERRLRVGDAARLEAELAAAEQARMQAALAGRRPHRPRQGPISVRGFPICVPWPALPLMRPPCPHPERIRDSAAFALHRAQP